MELRFKVVFGEVGKVAFLILIKSCLVGGSENRDLVTFAVALFEVLGLFEISGV